MLVLLVDQDELSLVAGQFRGHVMKAVVFGVVVMIGLLGNAQADVAYPANYNLGLIEAPTTVPFFHSAFKTGNNPSCIGDAAQYNFCDSFSFTLSPAATIDAISATIDLSSYYKIDRFQMSLVNLTTTAVVQAWTGGTGAGNGTVAVINPLNLTVGNYSLNFRGWVAGSLGGSYTGHMNAVPTDGSSSVPSPASYGLLMSGLGLLGLIGVKKRDSQKAAV